MNKLNKKGETSIGLFVVAFMGIIVALAIFGPIASTTGDMTNTRTTTNLTVTTASAANGTITLPGRETITTVTIINASDGTDWTGNFTIVTRNSGGALAILLKTTDLAVTNEVNGESANVTYDYKPQGYSDSSGARSIISIVLIFAAITIMAFAYAPVREALTNIGISN